MPEVTIKEASDLLEEKLKNVKGIAFVTDCKTQIVVFKNISENPYIPYKEFMGYPVKVVDGRDVQGAARGDNFQRWKKRDN